MKTRAGCLLRPPQSCDCYISDAANFTNAAGIHAVHVELSKSCVMPTYPVTPWCGRGCRRSAVHPCSTAASTNNTHPAVSPHQCTDISAVTGIERHPSAGSPLRTAVPHSTPHSLAAVQVHAIIHLSSFVAQLSMELTGCSGH